MIAPRSLLLVALGSAIGGCLRFAFHELALTLGALHYPWDTLFVNISGSLLIGWFAAITDPLSHPPGRLRITHHGREFIMIGVLGGYTTFSIFSLETMLMLENGQHGLALINSAASIVSCLLAVWAGDALAEKMNKSVSP